MHYYQFNIGNYYRHTSYLTHMEDLAYRRMLDRYYLNEQPFPDDANQIARKIGMTGYSSEVKNILCDFFILKDGFYHHEKADENLSEYAAKAETARVNGKKGGRPSKTQKKPKANPEETQLVNLANPEETGSKANHKPLTINQEPILKDLSPYGFDLTSWPSLPSAEIWKDFVKQRNSVKAKLSQTAINRMTKKLFEMQSKGWSVDDVLSTVCEKGWKSFEVEWLLKEQPKKQMSITDLMNDKSIRI